MLWHLIYRPDIGKSCLGRQLRVEHALARWTGLTFDTPEILCRVKVSEFQTVGREETKRVKVFLWLILWDDVGRVEAFERELFRLLNEVLDEDLVGNHPRRF